MNETLLRETAAQLAIPGRGILAADESTATIKKRFDSIKLESTEENQRAYRDLLFTTPHLGQYLSGVILFEETLYQKTSDGIPFPAYLTSQGVIPGIKVDQGLIPLVLANGEETTQGLDSLVYRLADYKKTAVKFAKWRCVYHIGANKPSEMIVHTNAESLARYAAICQSEDIVPIVEPEVLINGNHSIERCAHVMETVLRQVFIALRRHHVVLEGMILKSSMVTPGINHQRVDTQEIARATIRILKYTVPAAVASINFLSGGQTPAQATANLNAMHKLGSLPWNLSFSYGRALQEPVLQAWQGKDDNVIAAQTAFAKRMMLNSAASLGEYTPDMEKD